MSQSKMPTRALAPSCGCLTSMFIAGAPSKRAPAKARSSPIPGIRKRMNSLELTAPEAIIGRQRILHQDFAMERGGNSRRHSLIAVELPVRIVRRIEQYSIGTQMIDYPFHLVGIARCVEWLDGKADVVANDLGRRAVDPRHLRAHPAPELREPPEKAGKPGHAGFQQHHLEAGILGEHPFANQARHLRLKRLGVTGIILDVVARPTQRRDGMAVARAGMDAE